MNTVNSYFTTSPYDKTDECAQFVIDDLTKTFVFNDVMAIGQEYTFSFWAKADAEGTLIVKGETIAVSTEWKQHTVTFVAAAADLYLVFRTVGTYYLYHPQLEKGNKATDWVQAPEDFGESIQIISTQQSTLSQTVNGLSSTVSSNTTQISDMEKRVDEAESVIRQNANNIELKVSKNGVVSAINQSEESVTIDASKVNLNGYVTITDLKTPGSTEINGSNITTGSILADLIKAGVIKSKDGKSVVIDLDNGNVDLVGNIRTKKTLLYDESTGLYLQCQLDGTGIHVEIYELVDGTYNLIGETWVRDGLIEMSQTNGYGANYCTNEVLLTDSANGTRVRLANDPNAAQLELVANYDTVGDPLMVVATSTRRYITGLTDPEYPLWAANKDYVDKRTNDYIIDQGTSGIWTYRKWNSGVAECWYTDTTLSTSFPSTWGSLYVHDYLFPEQPFPFKFASIPYVFATPRHGYSGATTGDFWLYTGSSATIEKAPSFSVARPTKPSSEITIGICVYAKGRYQT